MSNVVISSHWTDGDIIPFIRIGEMLKKRGHKVTILTHCYYENMAKDAGLEFTAWDTPKQYQNLIRDMSKFNDNVAKSDDLFAFREKYESLDIRLSEFEKIKQFCKEKDTIILAKNRSSIAALMASEKFKCPIILFFMNPIEMESMLTFHHIYREMLKDESNELRKHAELPPISSWLAWQSSPKIQIALWPNWFSSETSEWPTKIETIGFPLKYNKNHSNNKIPVDIMQILKEDSTPILITGGTSKQLRSDFYKQAIKACEIIGKKTILVTRYEEFLPTVLPSNITWFKHIPLDDILPYMGAVIHHGGIGTVSGAIYASTPQLALACYVDRPFNARRVKNLGLGEYLPPSRWNPIEIAESLNKILEPDYKNKCLNFFNELPDDDALQEACKITESIVGKKEYAITYEQIIHSTRQSSCNSTLLKTDKVEPNNKKISLPQSLSPELREIILKNKLKIK